MPKYNRYVDGTIKRECIQCGVEKDLNKSFYKSNLAIYDNKMLICKECLKEIKDVEKIKDILKMHDIVFLENIWIQSNNNISEYLKNIFSLSQFINLRWKDSSIFENKKIDSQEKFLFQVENILRHELNCLVPKIKFARENDEFGTYKNLILAYKEVLKMYKELADEGNKK